MEKVNPENLVILNFFENSSTLLQIVKQINHYLLTELATTIPVYPSKFNDFETSSTGVSASFFVEHITSLNETVGHSVHVSIHRLIAHWDGEPTPTIRFCLTVSVLSRANNQSISTDIFEKCFDSFESLKTEVSGHWHLASCKEILKRHINEIIKILAF